MRRFFAKLHLWLSLPLGIILSVICFSGASLVFEREITQGVQPQLYRVAPPSAEARPLPPSELVARVREQLPDTLRIGSVQWPGSAAEPCMISFREVGRSQLSVDPYTGEVKGWTKTPAFFQTMRRLHRWLMDAPAAKGEMSFGKAVVGYATLAMVVILVSGVVIWVPRTRKAWKHRLRVSVRKGWPRFWYDSHVAVGFYAVVLLLVMALTGLTWSFGWYRTAAYALFGGGRTVAATTAVSAGASSPTDRAAEQQRPAFDPRAWDRVLGQLQALYPHHGAVNLSVDGEGQVASDPRAQVRRSDRVTFDPETGAIRSLLPADQQPRSQQLRSWFYAFHTGSWGGLTVKILWFLAALVGGTLPWTGYYLWLRRRRNARVARAGQAASR